MGFQLEHIEKQKGYEKSKPSFDINSILTKELVVLKKAFSNKTKESFYAELSILLNSGISLKAALELLTDTHKNKKVKGILNQILEDIVSGKSLSESISSHKDFTSYEYQSLRIGEETGSIANITEQLGGYFHRKNEQRKQVVNALTYPMIIISTAVLVVIFMLNFVVPMFTDIFKQQNVELPGITKFVVALSDVISNYGWMFIMIILALIICLPWLNKHARYKKFRDLGLMKVPIFGNVIIKMQLAQFTQAMTLLTASKVPVVESIKLVRQMISFYPLNKALDLVVQAILKGETMSSGLKKSKLFDQKMIAMIKVAEETNQTEYMFKRMNEQYNAQLQQQSKMLSTLLEPFIILFVGLFVGFILIAMYLPMFKLSSIMG
jgi:type II secretory pathway component PulF